MSQRTGKSRKVSSKSTPGASSSQGPSSPPPPPPQGQGYQVTLATRTQRAKYIALERRDIRSTHFYDKFTCEGLGIDRHVRAFSQNLGLGSFIDVLVPNSAVSIDPDFEMPFLPPRTYRELTLEFLSSFELRITSEEDQDLAFAVRFRIFNQLHSLSNNEFNDLFEWSNEAKNVDFNGSQCLEYFEDQWWREILLGDPTTILTKPKLLI